MTSTFLAAPETEELRAWQALGLGESPDIEALTSLPTARDRRRFNSLLRAKPELAQSMTIDMYKATRVNDRIYGTVKDFLGASSMLIRRLAGDVLHEPTIEEVRATPSVFLQRILNSVNSQDLTVRLLKKLKWYGAQPGEQTPDSVRHQLMCKAICLYLNAAPSSEAPEELAGFSWRAPALWGKSYQALRHDFEQHLLDTRRVGSTKEAIILAQIFQTRLSKDFSVPDIPPELRYKSSAVWVNFMHGVLLAEALDLNRSQLLSFQQLVDLPLVRSASATPEQLEQITKLRMGPALEWAVCMGIVQSRTESDYDEEDIKRAMAALDSQNESLNKAVMNLNIPLPERLKMAREFKNIVLGSHFFEQDGRKLLPEDTRYIGSRSTPTLKRPGHDFLDLYADGQIKEGKRWVVTQSDGKTRSVITLRIDDRRVLYSERMNSEGDYQRTSHHAPEWAGGTLPDINAKFETAFKDYLTIIRQAFETLIASMLASLTLPERRILAQGDIDVLRLRQRIKQGEEWADLKARKGYVLKVTHGDDIVYYELIPSAGIIRPRTTLRFSTINGVREEYPLHASIPGQTYSPERDISTSLLLDSTAHVHGRAPADKQSCIGILDTVGRVKAAVLPDSTPASEATDLASRLKEVAHLIATNHLYVDEKELRLQARGMTAFDKIRAKIEKRLEVLENIVKGFVPFWGSIDDLMSGDITKKIMGGVGLLVDLASFLFPMGKFLSGSVRLARAASGASNIVVKASLPSFSALTGKLLISSIKNLNPLDGIPTLLKGLLSGAGRGLLAGGRATLGGIKKLTGKADGYQLADQLPQAIDPGRWKPLTSTDELATVNGIDDVLVRPASPSDPKRLHLVDPVTSLPYGPRLRNDSRNLIQGRSSYQLLPPTESHALTQVPENARIHEMLEVDGRTTLLIDDIPYRLDGGHLRRADLIDDQSMFKTIPCRVRRMPGSDACKTSYVTRDPASTPASGTYDTDKGWAPWFGDCIYTPAVPNRAMLLKTLKKKSRLPATIAFQKGIYGRIRVDIPVGTRNRFDTFEAGAIIVPAIDDSRHYVFTRLGAGAFYIAELPKGQGISSSLTLRKATSLPADLKAELMKVYTGSLHANNMARIYGISTVERALATMENIAIRIGGHKNPPDTLKLLKVDTSPGEAVLFDHSTRMIVSRLPDGAASWSRSRDASDTFRQRAADIFDTLFTEKTINVQQSADLKINRTMDKLQAMLPPHFQGQNPRNIAYADIVTSTGKREVYVSVSGAQGLTGELPLFKPPFAPDQMIVGDTTYFNIDFGQTFNRTSLEVSSEGRLVAIPHTIKDIDTYTPELTRRPTSLDSEAKLISVLRQKYPENHMIASVDVATTMPPCNSCSVIVKEFGYDGTANALEVLWN